MPLLSHGGKFGCFTRLRFKGVCLLTTVIQSLYHVAKDLSGSVQYTSVNGAQCACRSLKKAVLLKCLKDRYDIYHTVYPCSELFSRNSRYIEAQPEQAEAKRRSA